MPIAIAQSATLYWVIIFFIILVSMIVSVYQFILLGRRANEWAWQSRKFESIKQFKAVQEEWRKWGVFLFFTPFVSFIIAVIIATIFPNIGQ